MELNKKKVYYNNPYYGSNIFNCNNVSIKLIDALKILKEIEDLHKVYIFEGILKRDIFNMDVDVKEFKEIFKLINK